MRLKHARPKLTIVLNGGLESLDACVEHSAGLDGMMVGRAAYQTPWMLAEVDQRLYGAAAGGMTRVDVVEAMVPYIAAHLARGGRLNTIVRHMLGLFHGQPGARAYRRILSEEAVRPGAGIDVVRRALEPVRGAVAARDAA